MGTSYLPKSLMSISALKMEICWRTDRKTDKLRQTHKQTKTDTLSHIEPGRIRRKAREDLALIGNSIRRHIHVDLEMFIARKFTSNSVPLQLLHLRSAEKVTNYKFFFSFLVSLGS